jgi:hypothetical protein
LLLANPLNPASLEIVRLVAASGEGKSRSACPADRSVFHYTPPRITTEIPPGLPGGFVRFFAVNGLSSEKPNDPQDKPAGFRENSDPRL